MGGRLWQRGLIGKLTLANVRESKTVPPPLQTQVHLWKCVWPRGQRADDDGQTSFRIRCCRQYKILVGEIPWIPLFSNECEFCEGDGGFGTPKTHFRRHIVEFPSERQHNGQHLCGQNARRVGYCSWEFASIIYRKIRVRACGDAQVYDDVAGRILWRRELREVVKSWHGTLVDKSVHVYHLGGV